jgi:iron complex transport system substrate-binding protein
MFIHRILRLTLAVLATFFLVTGPAQAGSITDTENRQVTVPDHPQRVLLGFYFEDFYAIVGPRAFDRVVAISRDAWAGWRSTQWSRYVVVTPGLEDIIDVGEVDAGTFNIEAAIASRPDVALLAAWQFRSLGDSVEKLEAAGIPVVVVDFNAQTLEKHEKSALTIGRLMGTEARAQQLVDEYKSAFSDVLARVKASVETQGRKRVYVELGNKGADTFGNSYADTMWGKVIELAGGQNIAAGKIENWGPLNPEYVIASNPDVILIPGSGWLNRPNAVLLGFDINTETTLERLRPYLQRPGWSGLNAVKNGEVHSVYHGGARTLYDYACL